MTVKPIPDGYQSITPFMLATNVEDLLNFLQQAFDAEVTTRMDYPDGGGIMHVEVKIGNSRVMMGPSSEEFPPMPAMLYYFVEDVDRVYQQALKAGAQSVQEPEDQFYGDRTAGVSDPLGNAWWLATHIEDPTPEEIARRIQELGQ